ncbi:MAG: sugar ABC transporter permease [Candidatus Rokuibacteriota bacterium]|nr:MAG: sugar ABC transporter permease [Candidatus Rokubacteria bacterium]
MLPPDAGIGYLFVLPLVVLVLLLIAYPLGSAVYLSLTEKYVGYPPRFVGLKNYVELTGDPVFRKVVWNSAVFTVASVTVKLVIGLLMALSLHKALFARRLVRGILLLPWVVPTVITALAWHWMFDALRGFINVSLETLGLISEPIAWLGQPATAMMAVVVVNIWRGFPFFGVSLLAGLQAIPADLYEAAAVDGASATQRFRHVTLPGLRPVILVTALISTIFTLNDFNIVYVMTRGGPGIATHILATYTYEVGFQALRWGRAVAVSMYLMPLVVVMIVVLARRLTRED